MKTAKIGSLTPIIVKLSWDFLIILAGLGFAIFFPTLFIFEHIAAEELAVLDLILSSLFAVDSLLNLQWYRSPSILHESRVNLILQQEIHLVKKYFWPDIISSLPLYFLFQLLLNEGGVWMQIFLLFHLLKLIRISQWMHFLRRKNLINPSIMRLLNLVFWVVLASHYISLGWLLFYSFPPDMDISSKYVKSLYWTITTLTTIGYGDITPAGNAQTIYAMAIELIGAGMYGFIIGNIATLISNRDIAKTHYQEKMEKIHTFMKFRNIPMELQEMVNNYHDYLWTTRRGYDEKQVLEDLPASLKTKISLFLNQNIIKKVPFLQGASPDLIRAIILNLQPVVFTPRDYVFREGDLGQDMYFISRGSVEIVSADGKNIYAVLQEGQFFGEIALLLSTARTASVRAADYCDLYQLQKVNFDKIIRNYPGFEKHIRDLAESRRQEINNKDSIN